MASTGYVDDTDRWGGLLLDFMEYVAELQWPLSVYSYARMRRDPQLTAIVAAHTLPIRRATVLLDGTGCQKKVVEQIADDLGVQVKGADDDPGPARRRGVVFADHLRLAANLHLVFGHMPFELEVDPKGQGGTRLVGLWERMPHTISKIETDRRTGGLLGFRQEEVSKSGELPPLIGRDRTAWYVHDREGNYWQGTSLLRPAFAPWLLKHEMWRVHATSNRRNGMGHPTMEALAGTAPSRQQMTEASAMAAAHRVGDQSGSATPPGFRLRLAGVEGSIPDTLSFIRYLDQQMSRMCLAGMLDLGDTPNGSRALGAEFVDLFMLSLQAIADGLAETTTSDVIVPLVNLNWGEDEPAPRLTITGVGEDYSVTATALQLLMQAGALSADPALEEYVRKTWHLPEKEEPPAEPAPKAAPVPAPGQPVVQSPGPGTLPPPGVPPEPQQAVPVAGAAGPFRRQPNEVELLAGTDFQRVQDNLDWYLTSLERQWAVTVGPAQAAALASQVEAAVTTNDEASLARIALPTEDARRILLAAMVELANLAAEQMREEVVAQGAQPAEEPQVDEERLGRVATVTALLLARGLSNHGARQALQRWDPEHPTQVADEVHDSVRGMSGAGLRDALSQAVQTAQNEGRLAVLRVAPGGRYFASEILDRATCQPCRDVDGTEFVNLAAAEDAYATGGFYACLGGSRCRGTVVARFETGQTAAASAGGGVRPKVPVPG